MLTKISLMKSLTQIYYSRCTLPKAALQAKVSMKYCLSDRSEKVKTF